MSRSAGYFNLFVYGTLKRGAARAAVLEPCEHVGPGRVGGTLYDIGGHYPALLLYGDAPVHGEIRRCPVALLPRLDRVEGTADGLFRRVGAEVETDAGPVPCWLYVAGPALARRLTPTARIAGGTWPSATDPRDVLY